MLLSSSIFNDYALQTLSTQAPEFPHISVYAPCVYRNCQLYLGSYNLRLSVPTLSVWNSLPIFDWTGLEPVTHLPLQNVFPLTPSVNIISVFIHLTIIYMVTDMKIIIYFIKVWFWVVGVVGLEPTLEWFWVIYLLPIGLHAHILRGIDIISPSQQKGELAYAITLSFPTDCILIISHLTVFVKRIYEKILKIFLRKCHCANNRHFLFFYLFVLPTPKLEDTAISFGSTCKL